MCYSLPLFYSKSVGSHELAQNHPRFVTPKLLESQALRSQKLTRQKINPFLPLLQEPETICEQDAGQCFESSRAETKAFYLPYCCAEFTLSCKDFTESTNLCGSFSSYTGGKLAGEQQSQEHLFRSTWKVDWFEVGAALSWMLHPQHLLGEAESAFPPLTSSHTCESNGKV